MLVQVSSRNDVVEGLECVRAGSQETWAGELDASSRACGYVTMSLPCPIQRAYYACSDLWIDRNAAWESVLLLYSALVIDSFKGPTVEKITS